MPSAVEVERDGIDLGAFQMRLLEKVEELTLYTIQQDEQLKQKDAEIADQEKQFAALAARLERMEAMMAKLVGEREGNRR